MRCQDNRVAKKPALELAELGEFHLPGEMARWRNRDAILGPMIGKIRLKKPEQQPFPSAVSFESSLRLSSLEPPLKTQNRTVLSILQWHGAL